MEMEKRTLEIRHKLKRPSGLALEKNQDKKWGDLKPASFRELAEEAVFVCQK